MAQETLKEALKQAAVEFANIEGEYLKAKAKFDNIFNRLMESRNGSSEPIGSPILPLGDTDGNRPLTAKVLSALPKDFRPLSLKQISALVAAQPRTVSATCSNLRAKGKIESAGRGAWRLKQPTN